MKFGRVEDPHTVDFSLPDDHPENIRVLRLGKGLADVRVGLPTWNRQLLKGFYPRGTKDELSFYASHFNSIEFNATFYNQWGSEQIRTWVDRTPEDFQFFPKVHQMISHVRRLGNVEHSIDLFAESVRHFGKKLGMCFLQMHDQFGPEHLKKLIAAVEYWPDDLPLAIELRNSEWFADGNIANEVYHLFECNKISNVLIDTPGRRDLMHMRLTTPNAFIRFLGCEQHLDFARLGKWSEKIRSWREHGLETLSFFLHHEPEIETIKLYDYFSKELSSSIDMDIGPSGQVLGQQQLF